MTMREKRMPGTAKFSVSMPITDFNEIESARRKAGKSRSQFLREAVLGERGRRTGEGRPGAVGEARASYVSVEPAVMTDEAEQRKRAIAAAGAFASGVRDLSTGHDRHLTDPGPDRDDGTSGRKGDGEEKP
jgi:hypothetical protein